MESIKLLADFFFPRLCEICKEKLVGNEKIICPKCLSEIKIADDDFLEVEFQRKFSHLNVIDKFTSLFLFETNGNLQHILHQFKYNQKFGIGKFLGELIADKKDKFFSEAQPDMIIPVPLHRLKKAERGYNQSYFIAKGIAAKLKIPVRENLVKRKRYTESQTRMDIKERKQNVSGVFFLKHAPEISGKKILLLDDVITTGATISELGNLLKNAGAAKVYAISAAIPTSGQEQTPQEGLSHFLEPSVPQ